jgi:hypothetical protein
VKTADSYRNVMVNHTKYAEIINKRLTQPFYTLFYRTSVSFEKKLPNGGDSSGLFILIQKLNLKRRNLALKQLMHGEIRSIRW